MKNSIILCFLAFTLLQSCNKDDDVPTCESCSFTCLDENDTNVTTNNCIDNWTCTFSISANSKVDLDENSGVATGNKNLFQFTASTEGDLAIADDEYSNTLIFELDDNQSSFSAEGGELENMKMHFRRACYCTDVEFRKVTSGCIQGEKQSDGTWFVQGDLLGPLSSGEIDLKFEAQFVN